MMTDAMTSFLLTSRLDEALPEYSLSPRKGQRHVEKRNVGPAHLPQQKQDLAVNADKAPVIRPQGFAHEDHHQQGQEPMYDSCPRHPTELSGNIGFCCADFPRTRGRVMGPVAPLLAAQDLLRFRRVLCVGRRFHGALKREER